MMSWLKAGELVQGQSLASPDPLPVTSAKAQPFKSFEPLIFRIQADVQLNKQYQQKEENKSKNSDCEGLDEG